MEYTKEKWEEIGLLQDMSEDRKDKAVHALNLALELMTSVAIHTYSITRESDGKTITSEDIARLETIFIPVLTRVVKVIDISDDRIKAMYNDMMFDYTIKRETEASAHYNEIDWETRYCVEYADKMIENLQSKQK